MDFQVSPPPTVILIDDDAALLRALSFSLELEGFTVDRHRSGSTVRPNDLPAENACLVVDYYLQGHNGFQLLERLRLHGVTLPAIVITSHAGPMLQNLAHRVNASVVEKPLLGPGLFAEIRRLIATQFPIR